MRLFDSDIKIHVKSEEESVKVQSLLFKIGYAWDIGGKEFRNVRAPYLFAYNIGNITYSNLESTFEKSPNFIKTCKVLEIYAAQCEKHYTIYGKEIK